MRNTSSDNSTATKSTEVHRAAWIGAAIFFLITFGIVVYLGADRLTSNPRDVVGTALLFSVLAGALGARIGWRFARSKAGQH